jgi:hypothetical protein
MSEQNGQHNDPVEEAFSPEGMEQLAAQEQGYVRGCSQTAAFALQIVERAKSLAEARDLLAKTSDELLKVRFRKAPSSPLLLDAISDRIYAEVG